MAFGVSYRYIVSDCLTILKKEEANADLTSMQVLYWAVTIANKLRLQHLLKSPTGRYLNIYTGIPILIANASINPNTVKGRKYIDLPAAVYDIINERGIEYICHTQDASCPPEFLGLNFQPTMPGMVAQRLTYSPYETPTPKNPYFYRIEDRVFFLGIEDVHVNSLEMGLYTSIDMRTNRLGMDDIIDLTEQHIDILRMQLLQLGGFANAQPKDRVNDSANISETQGKPVAVPQQQPVE